MEFDRKAPSGGLEITSTIESGKVNFECKVYLKGEKRDSSTNVDIRIWNREKELIFWGHHPLWQEEPARGIILHPRLWQGVEEPYLYRVRVALVNEGQREEEVLERSLVLRSLREIPMKGWFLNDRPLEIRAVAYEIPEVEEAPAATDGSVREEQIRRDLELIKEMGANSVCPIGEIREEVFCRICEETGLLLWQQFDEKMPRFWGMTDGLVTLENRFPTDRYYYYKACWSKSPFVYISMDSLILLPGGNAQVTVYSNQPKVALYVDGVLFEFRTEGPDFVFEEIPVKQLPLMLTAETRECSMSVTAYPIYKKSTKQLREGVESGSGNDVFGSI